jgi:release factor glutamine methyltransferase
MTSVAESLKAGSSALETAGITDPAREARSLLEFALVRGWAFIIAHPDHELTPTEDEIYRSSVARRAERIPLQHIVGRQEFYGFDFLVTPDVLIPRPETELIVERAIEHLAGISSPRFLEVGVGSGCISIAILKHVRKATAIAVDISEPAIDVARRNAEIHSVSDRLQLLNSNVFETVAAEKFDLIVSNPPYVPLDEYIELQPEVRDHDPRIAVTDGSTGLTIIDRIVAGAPNFLRSGAHLLIEIGYGQHENVIELFDPALWTRVEHVNDLQQIPRMVDAELG